MLTSIANKNYFPAEVSYSDKGRTSRDIDDDNWNFEGSVEADKQKYIQLCGK